MSGAPAHACSYLGVANVEVSEKKFHTDFFLLSSQLNNLQHKNIFVKILSPQISGIYRASILPI